MEEPELKGYPVAAGYIGILKDGSKMLFETEEAYKEHMREYMAG